MKRRFFLQSGTTLGIAGLLPVSERCVLSPSRLSSQQLSLALWEEIRKEFSLSPDRIHLSLMLLASHPRVVRDAIDRHRTGLDKDPVTYLESNQAEFENAVRDAAAQYIGAEPSEIALTDSTTMGLSVIYHGFRFSAGDEILTSTHDHYVTEKTLAFVSEKSGAKVRRVSLYDDPATASVEEMVSRIEASITSRTKLIAITHVHSGTGVKVPVSRIGDLLQEINQSRSEKDRIFLSVDGVHGFGVEDTTMTSLKCDFFSAGTHKWLFGPRGTGFAFARKDAWHMLSPVIPPFEDQPYLQWAGFLPQKEMSFAEQCTPGGFHSFEHRWALREAFDFMWNIGKERIAQRTHELSKMLKQGLTSMKHIRLITPMSDEISAGICCFEIDGVHPIDAVKKLADVGVIASFTPYSKLYVRFTPCILNSNEDVLRGLERLETIRG